jgi:hypothetical protein
MPPMGVHRSAGKLQRPGEETLVCRVAWSCAIDLGVV